MKKQLIPLLTAISLSSVTMYSQAESYIGVSFGTVDYSTTSLIEDAAVSAGVNLSSTTITESDSGTKFYYGYRVTDETAIELSYSDLGTAGSSGSGVSGAVNVVYESPVDVSSLALAGVYKFNTDSSFQPFAKLGLHVWSADLNFTTTASLSGFSATSGFQDSTVGTDLLYGVGFDVNLSDSLAFRLEYEIFDISNNLIKDASMFSAGLNYSF